MERLQLAAPAETTGASGTLSLVTVAETQAYIEKPGDSGGAFDTLIQTLIDSACQQFFGLTGGRFVKRPAAEFDFAITPESETVLRLHQFPVGTISLVEVGFMSSNGVWTVTQTPVPENWYADPRTGTLYGRISWPAGPYSVRVRWTGGFAAVPADAKEAVFQWVGVKLDKIRKARWDQTSLQGQTEGYTYGDELPAAAAAVIAKYAIPEISMA